jgi:hypothetical protein
MSMTRRRRTEIAATAMLLLAAAPSAAAATPPSVETMTVDYAQVLSGADSPCPFPVTFTGAGTVAVTTFTDQQGTPIRQAIHGALTHTLYSQWHTLASNGPAPVHVDLVGGEMIVTGNEFKFRLGGAGVVLGQAGRLVQAPDGSELSFTGRSTLDAAALCGALGP